MTIFLRVVLLELQLYHLLILLLNPIKTTITMNTMKALYSKLIPEDLVKPDGV